MKFNTISKNIPVDLNEISRMIYSEIKRITRSAYREQIEKHGIVIFTSRTSANIYFCNEHELLVAEKNTKFFRLPYVTFTLD